MPLRRLSSYKDEIIWVRWCGFWRNRSTTDQIFCIRQILEKNGSTMRQYISYSVRKEVLYNTLIEFGILVKLVRLIKMKHIVKSV
jgi:hypothetical protein